MPTSLKTEPDLAQPDRGASVREVPAGRGAARRGQVRLGALHVDPLTLDEAVAAIVERARTRPGGYVVTPNVDHLCRVEDDPELRAIYANAFLSLVDGMPLLWLAQSLRTPLPAKVSGSDLVEPLLHAAGRAGLSVYFLGATEEVCAAVAERFTREAPGLRVLGWSSPRYDPRSGDLDAVHAAFTEIEELQPHLVLCAFGSPKQEYLMWRFQHRMGGALTLGIGATLDFLAGKVQRAPRWVSHAGLEWLYRLIREPKRLWRRYLVDDRAFAGIWLRESLRRRSHVHLSLHGRPNNPKVTP